MGMPGSETCLEELMSRVLGDLVQEGCVSKIHLPLPNDASGLLQTVQSRTSSNLVPMQNWCLEYQCCHQTFCPIHYSICPHHTGSYQQQTLCSNIQQCQSRRVLCKFQSDHIPVYSSGIENLPSDFRNPRQCLDSSCQICKFITEMEDSVVRYRSVSDVVKGSIRMHFTSRSAWQTTQQDCPDLQRTHSHLHQGTRPSKKATKVIDVKRYLKEVVIASDGLPIVRDTPPFQPCCERIVVPWFEVDGLLTALQICFSHPSKYQLNCQFTCYFFTLDIERGLTALWDSCHHCQSLKSIPKHLQPQSTSKFHTSIKAFILQLMSCTTTVNAYSSWERLSLHTTWPLLLQVNSRIISAMQSWSYVQSSNPYRMVVWQSMWIPPMGSLP